MKVKANVKTGRWSDKSLMIRLFSDLEEISMVRILPIRVVLLDVILIGLVMSG